jgi:enterobacterial common antigen flippase
VTARKSYDQVVKSSALIGASSVINIGLGIVRTKAMAVLLGPSGIGLLGLYGSITELTRVVAGMGINTSGVRQIAEAVGSGDARRIAVTVGTLRRVALCTGALGSLLLLILCKPVSRLTFGDERHAGAVALLALAVFFGDISAAQGALVQGMRRIADLARISVLGAFYGTLLGIPIVYVFGEPGLAPSLVCVAAMAILTSWWYARKIKVERIHITRREVLVESSALLKLGVVFMATGFMAMGAAYLVRIIVLHKVGMEAAGFYQAAWVLGGLYAGVILNAMAADFYPRLTAVANNHPECNRLVNEQAEVGLLLGAPGIIATLVFAPLVIELFYSAKFGPAVEILRWICLGMMIRVISWPMGFVILAKGAGTIFFWVELLSHGLLIVFTWLSVLAFGLKGTGIGFCAMYVVNLTVTYVIAHRLSGLQWSSANRRTVLLLGPLILSVFAARYILPPFATMILGVTIMLLASVYSLKTLLTLLPTGHLPNTVLKMLVLFRLTPRVAPAEP